MSATESAIQIVFNVNLTKYTGRQQRLYRRHHHHAERDSDGLSALNGLGFGVQPLVSYNYGCGNSARIRRTVKIVALTALTVSVSVWLVSLLAPRVYGYIFSAEPPVMEILRRYTPVFMMGTVMFFAQMTLQNVFVALNQARAVHFSGDAPQGHTSYTAVLSAAARHGARPVCFTARGSPTASPGSSRASTFFIMLPRILKKREAALAREKSAAASASAGAQNG